MSEKIKFPELQALFENTAITVSTTPVVTFSGLTDEYVQFWKVNYPKGKGANKAAMLKLMMDTFFKSQGIVLNEKGHAVFTNQFLEGTKK